MCATELFVIHTSITNVRLVYNAFIRQLDPNRNLTLWTQEAGIPGRQSLSISPETGIPVSRPLNYLRETGIMVCLLTHTT